MLAAAMLREGLGPGRAVLDLCTGSGFLAMTAASHGADPVVAIDVSQRALLSARMNARLNGLQVEALRGDLFAPVGERRFDVIVSNPPYVPSPLPQPPRHGLARAWEAGPTGRVFIDRILAEAPLHLKPGGVLLLVHNAMCGERETIERLRTHGLGAEVQFRHHGSLGPRLRERANWLRSRGLRVEGDEVLIFRAQSPGPQGPGAGRGSTSARRASDARVPLAR